MNFPTSLLLNTAIKPVDKVVWCFISYINGKPLSVRDGAKALGLSIETYIKAITRLVDLGLIEREEGVLKNSTSVLKISTPSVLKNSTGVLKISTLSQKEKEKEKEKIPPTPPIIREKEKEKEKSTIVIKSQNSDFFTPSHRSGEQKQLTLDNIEKLRNEVETSQIKIEQYCKLLGLDRYSFIRIANEVLDEWIINEDTDITWKHLTNHMRIKLRNENRNGGGRENWKQQIMAVAYQTMDNINSRQ